MSAGASPLLRVFPRLCKGAPLLLALTLAHVWALPLLYLLYLGGAVGQGVFLATAISAPATALLAVLRGGGTLGWLDLLELFHKRRRICAAAPALYVISYGALAFVALVSIYLYTTPLLILEVGPAASALVGNATNASSIVLRFKILGAVSGGRLAALAVGGPAGYGWVFYASLWVASLYTAVAASLILAWRWVWRSADLVRRAEEFYEKAREILA